MRGEKEKGKKRRPDPILAIQYSFPIRETGEYHSSYLICLIIVEVVFDRSRLHKYNGMTWRTGEF